MVFSDGGDGEIRTLELVSELHDFQSCALDRTRRHLRAIIYAVSAATKHIIIAMREKIKSFFSNFLII